MKEEQEQEKVELYYLNEANRMVDVLFEGGLFKEGMTRKEMDVFAELLGFYLQSYAKSASRIAEFVVKYRDKKITR